MKQLKRQESAKATDGQVSAVLTGDLNMARCFKGSGIETLVASGDADNVLGYSRDVRRLRLISDPLNNAEQFIADLSELGMGLPGRPVLFYNNDGILRLIAKNRARLEPYYRFLMPDAELVEDLSDKGRFVRLSQRLDLPVPCTITSREALTADEALQQLSPPCVLKPGSRPTDWFGSDLIRAEGGKPQKVFRADTPEEFRRLYPRLRQYTDDFVMQRYIEGGDDCIYSFHTYFNRDSEPLGYFVGRKIRTYPKDSGLSTYIELVQEPEVARTGLAVLKKMKFVGPVKIDFKKEIRTGQLYILEFNARFTLWNYLGAACGINLLLACYADLMGLPWKLQTEYRTGVRWLSFGNDLRAFVKDYHRDGDLSWLQWLRSFGGPKVYDIFSWRDPLPLMATTWNYSAMLARKYAGRLLHIESGERSSVRREMK